MRDVEEEELVEIIPFIATADTVASACEGKEVMGLVGKDRAIAFRTSLKDLKLL